MERAAEKEERKKETHKKLIFFPHVFFLFRKNLHNTGRGLAAVLEKWRSGDYGACPRSACAGQPVLPLGPSDVPRAATVRVW